MWVLKQVKKKMILLSWYMVPESLFILIFKEGSSASLWYYQFSQDWWCIYMLSKVEWNIYTIIPSCTRLPLETWVSLKQSALELLCYKEKNLLLYLLHVKVQPNSNPVSTLKLEFWKQIKKTYTVYASNQTLMKERLNLKDTQKENGLIMMH